MIHGVQKVENKRCGVKSQFKKVVGVFLQRRVMADIAETINHGIEGVEFYEFRGQNKSWG